MFPTSEMWKLSSRRHGLGRGPEPRRELSHQLLAGVCCWPSAYHTLGLRAMLAKSCAALLSSGLGLRGWGFAPALHCLYHVAQDRCLDTGPPDSPTIRARYPQGPFHLSRSVGLCSVGNPASGKSKADFHRGWERGP